MYFCFRCDLRGFRGCVESHQAVAAVAAAPLLTSHISLPNALSHHLDQLDGTLHHLRELYRETTTCIYLRYLYLYPAMGYKGAYVREQLWVRGVGVVCG